MWETSVYYFSYDVQEVWLAIFLDIPIDTKVKYYFLFKYIAVCELFLIAYSVLAPKLKRMALNLMADKDIDAEIVIIALA